MLHSKLFNIYIGNKHNVMKNGPKRTTDVSTGRKEMFYLMTHSAHFIDGYMASDLSTEFCTTQLYHRIFPIE